MVPRAGVPLFNWINALPAVGTSKHSTPFLGILWTVDPTNLAIGAAFVKVKQLPAAQRAYAGNFTVLLLVEPRALDVNELEARHEARSSDSAP